MVQCYRIFLIFIFSFISTAAFSASHDYPKKDIGLEMFIAQPTAGANWIYGHSVTFGFADDASIPYYDYDPSFIWGWRLQGSYHINPNQSFTLSWVHFKEDFHTDLQTTNSSNNLLSQYLYNSNFNFLETNTDHKFNSITLAFNHQVPLSENFVLTWAYGAHWASIIFEQSMEAYDTNAFLSDTLSQRTKFAGLGPHASLSTSLKLSQRFSLNSQLGFGLLVGDIKVNSERESFEEDEGPTPRRFAESDSNQQRRIVPYTTFVSRINYLRELPNGEINVYLGWRHALYFNAQQALLNLPANPNSNFQRSHRRFADHNYAYHGPVFGFVWIY